MAAMNHDKAVGQQMDLCNVGNFKEISTISLMQAKLNVLCEIIYHIFKLITIFTNEDKTPFFFIQDKFEL